MKIGDTVKIGKCPIPALVGESAEIIERFEECDYPLKVEITSGKYQGTVYHFRYDEVEMLPKVVVTMKTHDTIKIGECPIPALVGESAEIIERFEECDYPLKVEITSGKYQGTVYHFRYDEVEMLPKVVAARKARNKRGDKAMKKGVEQVKEIVKGVTTVEGIAEIERVIGEAKGRILPERTLGFWEDKTPCWEMFRCPEAMRNECPAFKYRSLPCWQIEGTYCKLYDYGAKGDGTDICQVCRVYKRWGHGEPIEIKLLGKGLNDTLEALLK